ncbi:MAG: hypothetical protein [Podoviridae sp. cty5g4]|nr:MAG: hypothetical protein [Podoviridae sp. cty5g4]
MDLEELEERVAKDYARRKDTMKKRYRLAKDLGFSYQEAAILAGKNEKTIQSLASQRKNK